VLSLARLPGWEPSRDFSLSASWACVLRGRAEGRRICRSLDCKFAGASGVSQFVRAEVDDGEKEKQSTARQRSRPQRHDVRQARCAGAQVREMDEQGRSQRADRRRKAKRRVKSGFGDQGDRVTTSRRRSTGSRGAGASGVKRSSTTRRTSKGASKRTTKRSRRRGSARMKG
jgi:hypothetical protein